MQGQEKDKTRHLKKILAGVGFERHAPPRGKLIWLFLRAAAPAEAGIEPTPDVNPANPELAALPLGHPAYVVIKCHCLGSYGQRRVRGEAAAGRVWAMGFRETEGAKLHLGSCCAEGGRRGSWMTRSWEVTCWYLRYGKHIASIPKVTTGYCLSVYTAALLVCLSSHICPFSWLVNTLTKQQKPNFPEHRAVDTATQQHRLPQPLLS